MLFKNSRQTYALHLMNPLLNIFCYIISNVSIRKNLHMEQLMTESYPDRQDYSEKQCLYVYKGHERFSPFNMGQSSQDPKNLSNAKQSEAYIPSGFQTISRSIWGNQIKIPRISQMPNSQRHTSQVGFKLFPDQSGAIRSRFREPLKSINY